MKHYQRLKTRKFIRISILFVVFMFSLFLIGCTNEKSNEGKGTEYEKTEEILGTVVTGKVYGKNSKEALEEAFIRA